jgi:F1F0 ATPase subunit 2
MSLDMPASSVLFAWIAAPTGLLTGLLYFRALHRTVALVAWTRGGVRPAILTLARFAGAIAVLTLLARPGAASLLAGFAGFLLARVIALRSLPRTG